MKKDSVYEYAVLGESIKYCKTSYPVPKLTQKVIKMQKGRYSKKKLLEEVALFLYHFPTRYFGLSPDENSDFFLNVFQEIPRLLDTFEYTNIPFERFLIKVMQRRIVCLHKKHTLGIIRETTVMSVVESEQAIQSENQNFVHEMVEDISADYTPKIAHSLLYPSRPRKDGLNRELLCPTLIAADEIPTKQLMKLLTFCGCSKKQFFQWNHELRECKEKKRQQLQKLMKVKNKMYILLMEHQTFLRYAVSPQKQVELQEKIGVYKERLEILQNRIASYSLAPTHKEISQVTGIPLGSVSAGLAKFKEEITQAQFEDGENRTISSITIDKEQ